MNLVLPESQAHAMPVQNKRACHLITARHPIKLICCRDYKRFVEPFNPSAGR